MDFKFQRQLRLAGLVVIIAGAVLSNITIILLGDVLVLAGYLASVHKIERHFEQPPKEEDEDAVR